MQPKTPQDEPSPPVPLLYQSPGAHGKSQWITDDQPGGAWLVGCLLVLCGLGAVLGGVAWFLSSFFSGMGI